MIQDFEEYYYICFQDHDFLPEQLSSMVMLYLRNPKLLEMFFQHDNLDDYIDLMECDLRDRYLETQSEKNRDLCNSLSENIVMELISVIKRFQKRIVHFENRDEVEITADIQDAIAGSLNSKYDLHISREFTMGRAIKKLGETDLYIYAEKDGHVTDYAVLENKYIENLTYNISKDQNVLLKALKDCEKDTEICIVSNIPGRWESYFGKIYADKAKRSISLYKSKLSPQKIADKAEVYFCFSNHAKIIMTDNIAYVGSSNFSEESADNYESGFISRDVDFIEFLQEEVFPWIIDSSSEYKTDEELLFLETAIRKSIAMFGAMHEEYYQMFYLLSDHRGIEKWYYNTTSSVLHTRDLEKAKEICYQYLELLKRVNKIFDLRVFYEKKIDNLDTVIEEASHTIENMEMLFMGSVYDLAKFDEQDFVDEYLSECYAEAYDEKLDYYVDKAMSAASNAFAELAEEAKDEVDMLLRQIEALETLAKKVLKLFKSLPLNDIRIDNTKK